MKKVFCPKCGKMGYLFLDVVRSSKGKVYCYFSIVHSHNCHLGKLDDLPEELKPTAKKLIQKHNGGGRENGHVKV
jgi:hypothetical protein